MLKADFQFSRYLRKVLRRGMLNCVHIGSKAWLLLACLVGIETVVTSFFVEEHPAADASSAYGYGAGAGCGEAAAYYDYGYGAGDGDGAGYDAGYGYAEGRRLGGGGGGASSGTNNKVNTVAEMFWVSSMWASTLLSIVAVRQVRLLHHTFLTQERAAFTNISLDRATRIGGRRLGVGDDMDQRMSLAQALRDSAVFLGPEALDEPEFPTLWANQQTKIFGFMKASMLLHCWTVMLFILDFRLGEHSLLTGVLIAVSVSAWVFGIFPEILGKQTVVTCIGQVMHADENAVEFMRTVIARTNLRSDEAAGDHVVMNVNPMMRNGNGHGHGGQHGGGGGGRGAAVELPPQGGDGGRSSSGSSGAETD